MSREGCSLTTNPEGVVPEPVLEPAREQIETAEPVYLTALQVADLLQVDEKTVLRWSLQDASMPVLRRGRVVRFPRERLLVWLERQELRAARRSAQGQRKPSAA
jgi:excisionase family DNA binding protein